MPYARLIVIITSVPIALDRSAGYMRVRKHYSLSSYLLFNFRPDLISALVIRDPMAITSCWASVD